MKRIERQLHRWAKEAKKEAAIETRGSLFLLFPSEKDKSTAIILSKGDADERFSFQKVKLDEKGMTISVIGKTIGTLLDEKKR